MTPQEQIKLIPCTCGGAGYSAQFQIVRIPTTFKACASVYFCLGGCHREGVGMSEAQAALAWNNTFTRTKGADK